MERNKRHRLFLVLLALPFLALGAYLADLPLPVPAFALPRRSYFALAKDVEPSALAASFRRGESYASLPGSLRRMPRRGGAGALEGLGPSLPDFPLLEPILADLEAGIGLKRARIVISETPSAAEIASIRDLAERKGVPIELVVLPSRPLLPLLAARRRYLPGDRERSFELLLAPAARDCARIELAALGPGPRRLLYAAPGSALPEDLALRLAAGRAEAIELSCASPSGQITTKLLAFGGEASARPDILLVSRRRGTRSFIEEAYPCARASPEEAAGLDLHAFELVVLDGLPLASIQGPLLRSLLAVEARRSGSLLFAADSPEFGTKGANPELEAILPAVLLPRSLKDQPDMAVLVLVDASGSMFGDKLSLAKVTGLELLRALKPSDLVGLGLFSDRRKWLYGFAPASSLEAAPALEPLSAGGGTDLHAALSDGLDRLERSPLGRRHVILITDGITKPADFRALAERASSMGASISAMGVGEDADRPFLERLALGTGGRYYPVASAEAIPSLIFEDRASVARPAFATGRIPILSLGGDRIAVVSGMAQYAPAPEAAVLLMNELGDPLLASRESGNRAILLFTSDLYGAYTAGFFSSREAVGAFKDRLDALIADRPAEISVTESARGILLSLRSDSLVEPRVLLSRAGSEPIELSFRRSGDRDWAAETVLPYSGEWSAKLLDRGSSLASFPLFVDGGMGGARADAEAALAAYRPLPFSLARSASAWLLVFFASCLASTIALRGRR